MASVFSKEFTASIHLHASDLCSLILGSIEDVAIYMLDPLGRIVSWNTGAERVAGYTADDVLNRPFATLFTPADVAANVPQKFLTAALANGRHQDETTRTRKDGTSFVALLTLTPLFDDDQHIGFVVVTRDVSTERRRERQYQVMLENDPNVISVQDADGTQTYQSPSIERVLGYTPDELLGQKVWDFLHPDDLTVAAEYMNRLKAGVSDRSPVEVRFRHRSGEWRWFECVGTNLLDEPVVKGIQFTAKDITDGKLAEAELRRSERRYRTLATASNKLIWAATPTGEMIPFIEHNQTTFSGRTLEESSGWGWVNIVHPDDRDQATRQWREAVTSGQPLVTEARIRREDGQWRRIAARMVPVKDEAGNIEGWVGVGEDVTDLRNTEEWLRAVLNSTFDGIVTMNEQGHIVSANAAAHRKFGYTDGELVGAPVTVLIPEAERHRHTHGLAEHLRTGESRIIGTVQQMTGRRKDSSTFPIELTVTGFRLQEARHFTGVVRDLSQQRHAEAMLRASEQRLRAIIEAAPLCVKLVARDGTVVEMNAAGLRMVEAEQANEIVGQNIFLLVAPEDRDRYQDFHRAVCAGTPGTLEFEIIGKRGSRRKLEATATPFRIHGSAIGLLGMSQDVTERRQAEEKLRLRDRAIQAVSEGILITDPNQPDNPIIYASPGFERLTGYTEAEVIGRNCRFLQGKDTDPETVAEMRRAVAEGRPCTVEILNYRKDGTPVLERPVDLPGPGRDGRLTHFVGVQTRRDRAAAAGGAVPAGAEDGGGRPARRRRRPRLQQPAHRHHRLQRAAARQPAARPTRTGNCSRRSSKAGRAGGGADPAAARLQPPAGARAEGARPQRRRRRRREDAPPADRRGHPLCHQAGPRPRPRSRPTPARSSRCS